MSSDRAWLEAHMYSQPTTDADEFVAGMVKAHEGEPWKYVGEVFDGKPIWHAIERLSLLAETHGKDATLHFVPAHGGYPAQVRVRRPAGWKPPHFEVLNEWDPQP